MPTGEVVVTLKKILGRLPQSEFSSYDRPLDLILDKLSRMEEVLSLRQSFNEHVIRVLDVDSTPQKIDLGMPCFVVKLEASYAPIYVNYDREVTDAEFDVVYPDSCKVVSRIARYLWVKTPQGYTGRLRVFGLGVM